MTAIDLAAPPAWVDPDRWERASWWARSRHLGERDGRRERRRQYDREALTHRVCAVEACRRPGFRTRYQTLGGGWWCQDHYVAWLANRRKVTS